MLFEKLLPALLTPAELLGSWLIRLSSVVQLQLTRTRIAQAPIVPGTFVHETFKPRSRRELSAAECPRPNAGITFANPLGRAS